MNVMRAYQDKLRAIVLRHILGPLEVERLHLGPTDYVLVTVPNEPSTPELQLIGRQVRALFPSHRVIVRTTNVGLSEIPREVLQALLDQSEAPPLPYDTAI